MQSLVLSVFVIDSLTKVFPTTLPPEKPLQVIELACARNEYEAAQLALRANAACEVSLALSELRNEKGEVLPPEKQKVYFEKTIPIRKNTPVGDPSRLICKAPCEVPDPLIPGGRKALSPGRTEVAWLSFFVPPGCSSGKYTGTVTVSSGKVRLTVPVTIQVWPFAVPGERHLHVTNWVDFRRVAASHKVALWSDEFWKVWDRYLENLRAHRQTIVWIPWSLVRVSEKEDGSLHFDYRLFDRFVEALKRHGMAERLELQHVAHARSGWGSEVRLSQIQVRSTSTGETKKRPVTALLRDLERHLDAKGLLARAMIHVSDEPSASNVQSWRRASRAVHEAAPKLRRIDAIETSECGDDLEVWVPKLSHLVNWHERFEEARRKNKELWYYVCCHPYGGHFPNRFLDFPLSSIRLFHWINAAWDLKGYLHWGLNFYNPGDPFGPPSDRLPPGDTHVLYPGPEGPLSSMRWEVQRDSVEDYEYLYVLGKRLGEVKRALGPAGADFDPRRRVRELARLLVRNLYDPVLEPGEIRAVRRRVAEEIVAAQERPLVLLWTYPEEGSDLYEGPCVCEVYGAVEPGSTIRGLSRVALSPTGRFVGSATVSARRPEIVVTVAKQGKTKTLTRRFKVHK